MKGVLDHICEHVSYYLLNINTNKMCYIVTDSVWRLDPYGVDS